VVAGAALLGVSYLLVSHREHNTNTAAAILCNGKLVGSTVGAESLSGVASGSGNVSGPAVGVAPNQPIGVTCKRVLQNGVVPAPAAGTKATVLPPPSNQAYVENLRTAVASSQAHTLQSVLIESGVALGLMAVVSLGLGWWISGRVLRPVHRITDTARRLSERNLENRIRLNGPNDELKELADTFDAMLGRLDRAFNSQRRFVANASHELRTPLATERVLIDEALANRGADVSELRAILEQLRVNSEETERLIDALLVLARSERGVDRRAPVDLAAVAGAVVGQVSAVEALTDGIEIRTDLHPAETVADRGLIERLVGNLVENAVRHNVPGGWVSVATSREIDHVLLVVANSGRLLDPDTVGTLVQPFRRGGPDRSGEAGGFGLGLSIVEAIVTAHGGALSLAARPEGGLETSVRLAPPTLPGWEPARMAAAVAG
jgi:signal transduction histidine kinase